ncbi:MAG: SpoIIE family protein phosphatase [Leptospiraceae bacterium]|nr:SpoIIE family protein phosphatase [Leptospiraceae bacterium]NUM40824.1 SpoIIE family protein phosphatase [Leptospiraceae bacterium]
MRLISFIWVPLFLLSIEILATKNLPVIKGVLDLNQYSTDWSNPIELAGEWEYESKVLIRPENSFSKYVVLPNIWNRLPKSNEDTPMGNRIHRIKIIFPDNLLNSYDYYSVYVKRASTAYQLKVWNSSGQEIGVSEMSGVIGTSKENSWPQRRPIAAFFKPEKTVFVTFQVSNYHHYYGGPGAIVKFGKAETILRDTSIRIAFVGLLQGSLLMIGLYHLILFFIRRRDLPSLWFGVFCIITAFWYLIDENILQWYFYNKKAFYVLQYTFEVCLFSTAAVFVLYIQALFEPKKLQTYKKIILYPSYLLFVINLVIPLSSLIHQTIRNIFFGIVFFSIVWILSVVFLALKEKKSKTGLFMLIGIMVVLGSTAHDILYDLQFIRGFDRLIAPFGLTIFLLFQAVIIAVKNQRAYNLSEKLSNELEILVEERTNELKNSLKLIRQDLNFASRIQNKLMSVHIKKIDSYQIETMYIPMEVVGGDLFDISQMENGKIRILIADATGHGVQAAMITMLIISEYKALKENFDSPSMLLNVMNNIFISKYINLNYFFTCFLVDIDKINNTIRYASAGHPTQILIKQSEIVTLSKTGNLPGLRNNSIYMEKEENFFPGDKLLLFTDGLFEQFNSFNTEFTPPHY